MPIIDKVIGIVPGGGLIKSGIDTLLGFFGPPPVVGTDGGPTPDTRTRSAGIGALFGWALLGFLLYKLFSPNPGLAYSFIAAGTRKIGGRKRKVYVQKRSTPKRKKTKTVSVKKVSHSKSKGKRKGHKPSAKQLAALARGRAKRKANLRRG